MVTRNNSVVLSFILGALDGQLNSIARQPYLTLSVCLSRNTHTHTHTHQLSHYYSAAAAITSSFDFTYLQTDHSSLGWVPKEPLGTLSVSLMSVSLSLSLSLLSRWIWVSRYQNVILDFIGAKYDGDGGDNWSYKTCKALVKMSPTNQHPLLYRPDALPVAQPTVSKH